MELKAVNLSKNYPRQGRGSNYITAVSPANLTLAPGTVTVLTGRSGSGKTTLLNMMCGLLAPTQGQVLLGDTDLYSLPEPALAKLRNQRFGIIPQGRAMLDTLTVMENVLLPLELYGGAVTAEDRARAASLLESLGMTALADELPSCLSGGEVRRAAIARVCCTGRR